MRVLAFDTETTGTRWWSPDEQAFLATTYDGEREIAYDLANPDHVLDFINHLKLAEVLVAHNFPFDYHQVRHTLGFDIAEELEAEWYDTVNMARLLYPSGQQYVSHRLDDLAKVYVDPTAGDEEDVLDELAKSLGYRGIKPPKTHKGPWRAYYDCWRAYPEQLETYATKDARRTYDLYTLFSEKMAANEKLSALHEIERKVTPILIQAEEYGVAVDPEEAELLHRTYKQNEQHLRAVLEKELGEAALGGEGSQEALTEALLKLGVPLTEKTDSGKLSTKKSILDRFVDEFPVIRDFQEYRTVEKFLATYIDPLRGQTVVHCEFQQIGTWTGRMSCRRPNMQNVPIRSGPEIRQVFVARPGCKLVVSDYDSIEVRLLAHYLGEKGAEYRRLIREGLDPHAWMAAKLAELGSPIATHGTDPESYVKGSEGEHERAASKNSALFPIIYGAGGKRLCDLNGFDTGPPLQADDWEVKKGYKQVGEPSYRLGKQLSWDVKDAIPGFKYLQKRVKDKIQTTGYVTTIGGRKQPVGKDKAYVGLNALIQGSAADVMKMGLIRLAEQLEGSGAHILLVVHDEVVVECPEDQAERCLAVTNCALADAMELDPPLKATGKIVDRYGEAK